MIEYYIEFYASHKIAVAFIILQLAIRPVVTWAGYTVPVEKRAGWVDRYKSAPKMVQGVIDGILLATSSFMGEWWVKSMVLPAIDAGGWAIVVTATQSVIGTGIGLSIGKAITETDYTWFNS